MFQKDTVLPSEIFNHENFKALRQKLYNDEWPAGCDTCMNMEDVGVESMRHDFLLEEDGIFYKNAGRPKTNPSPATMSYYRRYHKERVPDNFYLIDCYDKNTHYVKPEGLRHVELRFSNACNFACLHCSKVFSTGWKKKLQNYEPDREAHLYDLKQIWSTPTFYNLYGPTETNVCTYFKVPDSISNKRLEPFPIGKKCSHYLCKVMDEFNKEST